MRLYITWLPFLLIGTVSICEAQARRIRVQPRLIPQEEAEETIQYYSAEPQEEADDNRQRVVLVSSADQYNGLYGQQNERAAASRSAQDNYIPRGAQKTQHLYAQRVKESPKAPPVQTIRNYNKVNDDGSFTFGYEAADGSFKEETRGTDCVVRGKYGYVDPDGNKREFTYVSGNPCDPNAPKEEEEEPADFPSTVRLVWKRGILVGRADGRQRVRGRDGSLVVLESKEIENENIPANYPTRPIRPLQRPVSTIAPKPAVTLFQNTYDQGEDEQPEPEQLLRPTPTPIIRSKPQYIARPQYQEQAYARPQSVPSSTPSSTIYRQQYQPLSITPRPLHQTASPTIATRTQLPATTFRPQQLQVAVTPRPALLYTPKGIGSTSSKGIDFDAEFQRFQQENNVVSPTPNSIQHQTGKPETASVGQVYSSQLIYDPATGQYKNQLYQTLPQSEGDFTINQRIQPYVHQQQQRPQVSLQQLQQQSPLYRQQVQQINPQAVYQAQQSDQQFQNSAQLYAQQQRAREQQPSSAQQRQTLQPSSVAPPIYYIQPSVNSAGAVGAGQIDAFLRGHNIQF